MRPCIVSVVDSVTEQALASALALDRLPEAGPSLDVGLLNDTQILLTHRGGRASPTGTNYHELIWTREAQADT
jgi:hypothetical protein